MTTRTFRRALPLLVALAALAPRSARAESHEIATIAFGWLVEHADAVVVAVAREETPLGDQGAGLLTLEVEESIRGPLAAKATAEVRIQDLSEGRTWVLGEPHLVFLRTLPAREGEPERWGFLSGDYGIRVVPATGPESRFPGICREIAKTLAEDGSVGDAAAYRRLLVGWIEDEDQGVAWSAATDLVRHEEMHEALTAEESGRIVAAFERQPIGKVTKKAMALAVAATRDPAAGAALVRSLLHPRAREIRIEVGEALRRLGNPDATAFLLQTLGAAGPDAKANLLNVLGIMAPPSATAAEAARTWVRDPDAAVRLEAMHALGLVTRELHRASPSTELKGRVDLLEVLAAATTENEQVAAVWALAQFDEPLAYEALRRIAAEDERPWVRTAAERYLANPRLSLILR